MNASDAQRQSAHEKLTKRQQEATHEAAALSSLSAKDANEGVHGAKLAMVFFGLMMAMFVSSISETIAATALPTIAGDLGGVEMMQWVSTTYILASTVTMPIYGKLGDLRGRKHLLMAALGIYALGKVVCGLTPNMAGLIVGRAISGIGGGGLIILSQAIIADVVSPRDRGKYLGVMGSVFAVSTVLGPLLGGWFVETTGWRMIFAFTIPLAVLAIIACGFFLKQPKKPAKSAPIDVPGMVFMVLAVISLILAAAWGGAQFAWDSWQIIGLFALAIASAVLFVLCERRAKDPIIPLLLFKNRNFVLCTVTGMCIYIGFMGTVTYLPTYLQIVKGLAPEIAGLMTTPMMAGVLITSTATGFIASHTGKYKWMPIAMTVVAGIGFALLSTITPETPLPTMMVFFFLLGFGLGLGQQILVLVVQNEFPHAIVGTATASNNFFRQIGSTLGASLVGAMFTSRLAADLAGKIPAADNITISSLTPAVVDKLPDSLQQIIAAGYSDALVPLFAYFVPLAIAGLVLMLFLKENPLSKTIDHGGHPQDDM